MKLIKRTYRITTEQDKIVKVSSGKYGFTSESDFIRTLIDKYNFRPEYK